MRNWKTILIFTAAICAGLFLLNHVLEGIPGTSCKCMDDMVVDIQCELACAFSDGCSFIISWSSGHCIEDECWTPVVFYCELERAPGVPIQVAGWHCYPDCSDCDPL